MNIVITSEKECWVCGSTKSLTNHHAIPKRMSPKRNALIPICDKCHKTIHEKDINGFLTMLSRLEDGTRKLGKEVGLLRSRINTEEFNYEEAKQTAK